jgi:flagellin-like protein
MKGISPLVATVLLIALTIGTAVIISTWLTTFTRTSTEIVGGEASTNIICSYGGLNLKSLSYNSTTTKLAGYIENTGTIPLGNISLQIIYDNATDQKLPLCLSGSTVVNCTVANMTLKTREQISFNVWISSNFEKIRVVSNCSTSFDEVSKSDVS